MKKSAPKMLSQLVASLALLGGMSVAGVAEAALMLTVNTYTTNSISLTISGSFDAATIGDSKGYLAIKNAWSSNKGVHTEWFAINPTVTSNTVTIGGRTAGINVQNQNSTWGDNVFWVNPFGSESAIAAGTVVSGTLVLSGVGAFNPANASTLELVSGFSRPVGRDDWVRLEARSGATTAVPEPASLGLLGAGVAAFAALRRRKKVSQA